MTTSSFTDIGLFEAKGRRTQAFKQTKNSNNKTNKAKQQTNNSNNKTKQQTNNSNNKTKQQTKKCNNKTNQQTNNCNNKTKQQTNKSAILQMWYATARPSCRNVRRTQGFLLQTCFRLRWGLLCYQVKTLSPARKMIRGPRESVFGTQCEQHLNKFQASSCILPTFILSFLSQFTCFAPFFLFCPIVSFFYQFFSFFSHFTNIAGASQCSNCDCNFCKSPGSGSLPKIHRYINCYKTALLPVFTL